MSDDEDYYDDDFEGDWLWYEDINLGVADDLAETATHSPIPIEDPRYDTVDVHSDWDYYSDDYYDDDPTVMYQRKTKGQLQDADDRRTPPRKKLRQDSNNGGANGSSMETTVAELLTDTASFKGVMWKKPDTMDQKPAVYEPGNGERVALLKDWRSVLKPFESDWFQSPNQDRVRKRSFVNGRHHQSTHDLQELAPDRQEDTVINEDYSISLGTARETSYSPPPSTIDDLRKPREPKIQKSQLSEPTSRLKEVVTLDDDSSKVPTPASPLVEENEKPEESGTKQPQRKWQKLLRVEIPISPSVSDLFPSDSTNRRRERRPRGSAVVGGRKPGLRAPMKNAKKAATEEENSPDRRRSGRGASSAPKVTPASNNDNRRKRKRAPSPPPPRRGRPKKAKVD